jgi:hypothetical protein
MVAVAATAAEPLPKAPAPCTPTSPNLAARSPNAKKTLRKIAKQTGTALPLRYLVRLPALRSAVASPRPPAARVPYAAAWSIPPFLTSQIQARLIYHDAAGSSSPCSVAAGTSSNRVQLLQEAYELAAASTALAPNSLSCAALRATLAINLLVEESALTGAPPLAGTSGRRAPEQPTTLDRKCHELRARFHSSLDACRTALEHKSPMLMEPIITLTTPTHTTCDPCSLVRPAACYCDACSRALLGSWPTVHAHMLAGPWPRHPEWILPLCRSSHCGRIIISPAWRCAQLSGVEC